MLKMAAERAGSDDSFDTRTVEFWSDGFRLRGRFRFPRLVEGPGAAIVFTPGWLGLAESGATTHWLDAFASSGFCVLSFDYRGFGDSEGPAGLVRPDWQLEDIRNAVTLVAAQAEVDSDRIGLFGKGGTGGGNAFAAAALDDRIRCAVAMTPVADGATWLRGMRREYEWREFLQRVKDAERQRVVHGDDPKVDPRSEIMVAVPERSSVPNKSAVDAKVGSEFGFSTAAHVLRYRPVDVAHRLAGRPILIIGIEEDAVTPLEHARSLFAAVGRPPRQLAILRGAAHYAADSMFFKSTSRLAVEWAHRFLKPRHEISAAELASDDVLYPPPESM